MRLILAIGLGTACFIIGTALLKRHIHRHSTDNIELLQSFIQRKQLLHIYVGYPLHKPVKWVKVLPTGEDKLDLGIHGKVKAKNVKRFLVTYLNGEVLYSPRLPRSLYPLPDGAYFLERHQNPSPPLLPNQSHIAEGQQYIKISHGKSKSQSRNPRYYSTSLQNISGKKIRVTRFAAFTEKDGQYVLSTVSGEYFTDRQFQEWYGVEADGWIQPGETVTDWENYGGRSGQRIWAYFCEDEDGKEFIAAAAYPGK